MLIVCDGDMDTLEWLDTQVTRRAWQLYGIEVNEQGALWVDCLSLLYSLLLVTFASMMKISSRTILFLC